MAALPPFSLLGCEEHMIVFAILGTLAALAWSFLVAFANGMRSSPGDFVGGWSVGGAWFGAAVLWLAWWVG